MYIFMKNLILIIILVLSLAWNWYFIYQELLQKKELIVENKGEKNDEKYILDKKSDDFMKLRAFYYLAFIDANDWQDALKYIVKIDDKDKETRAIFLWNENKFPLEIVLEETQEKALWKVWESLYTDFEYKKWIISSINEYLKTNDLEEKYLLTLKRIIEKQYEWQKDVVQSYTWRDKDFWYKTSLEKLLETINKKLEKAKK